MSSFELPYPLSEGASQVALSRVVGTAEAAAYCNISVTHWRRLVREGKVPAPIKLSARKLGWRLGALVEFSNRQQLTA